MDTSDTSDFESADEFLSDSEIDPAEDNSLNQIKKVENNLINNGIEAKPTDEETLQNPEQSCEPVIEKNDAIINFVVEKIEKMTQGFEDNQNKEENVSVPSMDNTPTSCWIPELHEAHIKRDVSNFVPGPPKFDRDGNPIVPKEHIINEPTNKIEESTVTNVPRIKTTCWVPALNEVNKKRLENEKHPPKPPTVDRDGNPIAHRIVEPEKGSENDIKEVKNDENVKLSPEKCEVDTNLWDDSDQWEVEEPTSINHPENDFLTWGDDETWLNNENTPRKNDAPASSKSSDDNTWENDRWESLETNLQTNKPPEDNPTNQAWSNWGIFSVLNTVSQGLTTVIGVPEPELLAKEHSALKDAQIVETPTAKDMVSESGDSFVGLGSLVSGVTRLVESTGTRVISGGLETLETIGKKTMEVLQENDPGLKKKRAFLKKIEPEKTVLSQVLREAKEQAEGMDAWAAGRGRTERAVCYEILFDDYQGLMHLEALSMLSRQCTIKLHTITSHLFGAALTDLQETLDQVKELCELPTEDDQLTSITPCEFNEATLVAIGDLNVPISFGPFVEAWRTLTVAEERDSAKDVHRRAVEALAMFTALAVEQMHKGGEMLLVKGRRSTADEADGLVQICSVVIAMLNCVAVQFTDKLSGFLEEEGKDVNQYMTDVFLECSTSTQYIQQAFHLLIPVLQVGAT